MSIALIMMVRNEADHVLRTFHSVPHIQTFVIMDTGSTDQTIAVVHNYCAEHHITLHLTQQPFVDFATNRNQLLRFADEHAREPWFLLMDADDEFQGDLEGMIAGADARDGIYIQQKWIFGTRSTSFQNVRCIRARVGWHYVGVVHEYLTKEGKENCHHATATIAQIIQNRELGGHKSEARFARDYKLLHAEVARNPENARAVFYLARTCDALGARGEAKRYFQQRAQMKEGFYEEVFHSLSSLAEIEQVEGKKVNAMRWYREAYECDPARIDPLIALALFYIEVKNWHAAFLFLERATKMPMPARLLFMDERKYSYWRWHWMGVVAYYVGERTVGKEACTRALATSETAEERENNQRNLEFY